ncbi:MAG: hypothetical protein EZS28_050580, partial [Streblomastix strix]
MGRRTGRDKSYRRQQIIKTTTLITSYDNTKHITLEKGTKRKYSRKSKEKIPALMDQMIKEKSKTETIIEVKEEINEKVNEEPIIRYKNDHSELLDKHDEEHRLKHEQEETKAKQLIDILFPFFAQQMQDIMNKTISERVKNVMVDVVNYTKVALQESQKKYVTGKMIDLSIVEDSQL